MYIAAFLAIAASEATGCCAPVSTIARIPIIEATTSVESSKNIHTHNFRTGKRCKNEESSAKYKKIIPSTTTSAS